jgi:Protein of unknown function (DUF2442)
MQMTDLIQPVRVEPREGYRIHLEFSDGAKGEVDLSQWAGKGVFQAWNDRAFFERVHIGNHREIKWNDEIELCADSLYLEITHKRVDELFPSVRHEQPHA